MAVYYIEALAGVGTGRCGAQKIYLGGTLQRETNSRHQLLGAWSTSSRALRHTPRVAHAVGHAGGRGTVSIVTGDATSTVPAASPKDPAAVLPLFT